MKMKLFPQICLVLLSMSWLSAREVWPDDTATNDAEDPNIVSKRIVLGRGFSIKAIFSITTKGNGWLEVSGLGIRVYDSHNDGIIYRRGLLKCIWKDENGDGILDLVVSGTAEHWNEKGLKVESVSDVRGLFRYVSSERRFVAVECSPEIYHSKL